MTEHEGFAVPTLPSTLPSRVPASSPTAPLVGPTQPVLAIPTLPPAGTPAPSPASPATPTADAAPVTPGPSTPSAPPAWKQRQQSRRRVVRFVRAIVALGVVAAGAYVGVQRFAGSDAEPVDTAAVSPPLALDPDAGLESRNGSGIGIIDDANDVVDQINENADEAEALELLGLTPSAPFAAAPTDVVTGDEVAAGAAVPANPPSYSFIWSYPTGVSITAWVDATTGDYQMTTADGLVVRNVDGTVYEQTTIGGPWQISTLADEANRAFVGRDQMIDVATVVPAELLPHTVATDLDANGFGTYAIDDIAFERDDPGRRATLLTVWGFDPTVPADAGSERILIGVDGGIDGTVTRASVTTAAGTSTYTLLDVSAERRAITIPPLG